MIKTTLATPYGELRVLSLESIFQQTIGFMHEAMVQKEGDPISVGLTGGSTPKAFYQWAAEGSALSPAMLERIYWFTSDERMVPLASDESNFGTAQRLLFDPLKAPNHHLFPWPTEGNSAEAAQAFNETWNERFSPSTCFDVCFLGMGDDCHTASLFPQSPLIGADVDTNFATVEVPSKGPRLTITEAGLSRCAQIVITVTGKGKAAALKTVLEGKFDPKNAPSQVLKAFAEKVVWLVDEAASSELSLG
tara:strand:- start:8133 stop:8879 length:747 start_codon:yes stop_codon:yes gene_type:complete